MRTGTKLNDGGPYGNMFLESVTYNNDLAALSGRVGRFGRFPGFETLG
jgi:hypothetical protein